MTGIPEVTTRRFRSASDLAHELEKTKAQADVAPAPPKRTGYGWSSNAERMRSWRETQKRVMAEMGIGATERPAESHGVTPQAPQSNDARMASWRATQKRVKAEMGIGPRN
jgi:hypothetical protein